MSDLISRKALIEKIRKYGICGSGYSDEERINDVIDMIESEPSAQQWIPCSERLPEEGEEVLIATKTSDKIYFGMYIKRYGFSMREGFICVEDFMWLNTAIAWMPLPEPMKTKE